MASIFIHPAVPAAIAMGMGRDAISTRLLVVAMVATIFPDIDVLAFRFDIPYADPFGHRGWTHSILFAAGMGALAAMAAPYLGATRWAAFLLITISMASHGLLDAMTNGGLGVAFFWPLTDARYFLPWQPIEVSPIGAARFFTSRGLDVIWSELVWIGLPLLVLGAGGMALRRWKGRADA